MRSTTAFTSTAGAPAGPGRRTGGTPASPASPSSPVTPTTRLSTTRGTYAEGTEWPDGDRLRRKDAVPDRDWAAVWSVMRTLANLHGDEGVRLVVWFDG